MSELLNSLRKHKDNRGVMSSLRCAIVPSKIHLSWPVLSRLGIDISKNVDVIIAGLYATHPEESSYGNLGTTCLSIKNKRNEKQGGEEKCTPTEKHFQHLLSAEPGRELVQRIIRLVLLAKSLGVPINYVELEKNLKSWSEKIKTSWAISFWSHSAEDKL